MTTEPRTSTGSGRVELLDDRTAVQLESEVNATSQIPHDCAPETLVSEDPQLAVRLIGLDVARAVAIVGMVAVHLLPMVTADRVMSIPFVLASGKSAALFAVLAGVGIALSTGRTRRPTGRRWQASLAEVAVRALLIGVLGLTLGHIVPADNAQVILPYYAALFLLALPLLRMPPRTLAILAVVVAVGVPLLSHWWRQVLPPAREMNPSFATVAAQPVSSLEMLFVTGAFPALAWMAYVCAGIAIGRAALSERRLMVQLVILGAGLAVMASVASWFLMEAMGGREKLAAIASQSMTLDDFTDFLVWGGEGALPTTSPWWLGVLAPHTTTPVDLLFTLGIAVATIGVALILGVVTPNVLRPVAAFGSMPLTLYTVHLLLLVVPFMPEPGWRAFALHLVILTVFAVVWRKFAKRGPLELVLGWAAHRVGRQILNRARHRAKT